MRREKGLWACHGLGRRLGGKGCWLGACWLSDFTLEEVSPC